MSEAERASAKVRAWSFTVLGVVFGGAIVLVLVLGFTSNKSGSTSFAIVLAIGLLLVIRIAVKYWARYNKLR